MVKKSIYQAKKRPSFDRQYAEVTAWQGHMLKRQDVAVLQAISQTYKFVLESADVHVADNRVRTIYLSKKGLVKIPPELTGFELHELYLNNNLIGGIENLETQTELTVLELMGNRIPLIEGLANTKLRKLNLSNNRVSSLVGLETLTSLEEVYLANNPIDWDKYQTFVQQLADRFVNIEK